MLRLPESYDFRDEEAALLARLPDPLPRVGQAARMAEATKAARGGRHVGAAKPDRLGPLIEQLRRTFAAMAIPPENIALGETEVPTILGPGSFWDFGLMDAAGRTDTVIEAKLVDRMSSAGGLQVFAHMLGEMQAVRMAEATAPRFIGVVFAVMCPHSPYGLQARACSEETNRRRVGLACGAVRRMERMGLLSAGAVVASSDRDGRTSDGEFSLRRLLAMAYRSLPPAVMRPCPDTPGPRWRWRGRGN